MALFEDRSGGGAVAVSENGMCKPLALPTDRDFVSARDVSEAMGFQDGVHFYIKGLTTHVFVKERHVRSQTWYEGDMLMCRRPRSNAIFSGVVGAVAVVPSKRFMH
jgi:hypothetical protein